MFGTASGVGFGALLGAERAKARRARDEAALQAARDKMTLPLVYFGSWDEPHGVDRIRVYWNGEIVQHSTCVDCGGHIRRVSDKARRWAQHCGCNKDRPHFQQMKAQRTTRKRQADHRKQHGGISDYRMKQIEDEWNRAERDLDDDYEAD
ncbi:hypothetical protein B8W68_25235 [Mycobacterium paraintracellulare]|nr:hypothetical protein B8W68_25235 [Mycobacterium paraintracellulare]